MFHRNVIATPLALIGVSLALAACSGWSLSPPNSLQFASAPAAGVSIAATFTYAFQCRFDSDDQDFEEFMANLWKIDSVKFKSVRTS